MDHQYGSTGCTVTVVDGNGSSDSEDIILTVNAVNDILSLGAIDASYVTNEDENLTVHVCVTDPDIETNFDDIVFEVDCNNSSLGIPAIGEIDIEDDDEECAIFIYHLYENQHGNDTCTITATESPAGNSESATFSLEVIPVNDDPQLHLIGDQITDEDIDFIISVTAEDPDIITDEQVLTFSLECNDDSLVETSCVSTGDNSANCTFDVMDDACGVADCMVTVNDQINDRAIDLEQFTLTVNSINDSPILYAIGDLSTNEDEDYSIVISSDDIDLSTSCPDEGLTYTVECENNDLVIPSCEVLNDEEIECTFDVQDNQFGNTTCLASVLDSFDGSDSEEFTFIVHPVNDEIEVSLCPTTSWEIEFNVDPEYTNMALLSYTAAYSDLDSCFGVYDIDSDLEFEWTVSGMNGNDEPMVVSGSTLEFYSPIDSEIFIDLHIYEIHSIDIDGDGILDDVQETVSHSSVHPFMLVADVFGCDGEMAEYDECDVCSGCGLLEYYYDNDSDCFYEDFAGLYCSEKGELSEYDLPDDNMITGSPCVSGDCDFLPWGPDYNWNYFCQEVDDEGENYIDECGECAGCNACDSPLGDGNLDQVVDIMDIMVVIEYLFNDLDALGLNELPEDDLDCLESSIYIDGCDGSLDPLGDFPDQDYSILIGENNIQYENINVNIANGCTDHCDACIDILDIVGIVEIIFNDDLSRDFADNVHLVKDANDLRLETNGDVSLHLVLNHGLGFDLTLSDQGYIQDYQTNGTRTDIILLMPDNGTILSSTNSFEVVEITAATNGEYIDVDYDVIPNEFVLEDVYPNPFNPTTNIAYSLPITSEISIRIFDIQGREIDVLYDNIQDAGSHMLVWDASSFATGIYFVKMSSGSFTGMKKIMLIK